jgi:hypothetical protein
LRGFAKDGNGTAGVPGGQVKVLATAFAEANADRDNGARSFPGPPQPER